MRVFTRLLMFVASLLSFLAAQTPVDPTGHWEGVVQVPDRPLAIAVDLVARSGALTGTFAQPAQGIKALPLTTVSAKGRAVTFLVKGNDEGSTFAGVIAADGQTMTGEVTYGEYLIPFTLTRTGEARVAAAPVSPAISTALEGTWDGTLLADGSPVHLRVRLANQADGTSRGVIVSTTGSGVEIPIAILQKGTSVTLTVDAVGASFSGELNAAGTEVGGTWSQGNAALALTLTRAKQ